jgi:hypothetical protein
LFCGRTFLFGDPAVNRLYESRTVGRNDGKTDQWTEWKEVKEAYDYIPGFSKQVKKTPASLDVSSLPEGYGFQFEIKLTDSTDNKSKPILESVELGFKN